MAEAVRVRFPPVPVIVNSSLPNEAVLAALIVSVETGSVEDTEVGEKEPVRPVPRPDTLNATGEVNPPAGFNVTVYSRDELCATSPLTGDTEREKSGAVAVAVAVAVNVWAPLVPVTVNSSLPIVAVALAVSVSVEVASDPSSESSEKEPVRPDRKPETLNATAEVNPAARSNVSSYVPVDPRLIPRFDGEISKRKSFTITVATT